jgi:hypothetical protein
MGGIVHVEQTMVFPTCASKAIARFDLKHMRREKDSIPTPTSCRQSVDAVPLSGLYLGCL